MGSSHGKMGRMILTTFMFAMELKIHAYDLYSNLSGRVRRVMQVRGLSCLVFAGDFVR